MRKKNKKIKSALDFLRYLSKPLDETVIDKQIKDNDIIFERIDLYISFIRSLYSKIIDTYLGDDVINTDDTKEGHFDWCWNSTIKDFRHSDRDWETSNKTNV